MSLSYSRDMVGPNDLAYFERREEIYVALDTHGPTTCQATREDKR